MNSQCLSLTVVPPPCGCLLAACLCCHSLPTAPPADLDYSSCHVEKILDSRQAEDGTGEEFFCKFEGEQAWGGVAWVLFCRR